MWLVRTNTELENKSVAIERIDEYCHLKSEVNFANYNLIHCVSYHFRFS